MTYEIKSAAQILKEKYKVEKKRVYEVGAVYNTRRWKRFSRWFRSKNPFCEAEGCEFLSADTDHIIPIKEGGLVWSEKNLQALCKSCHAVKSAKDRLKYS